MCPNAPQTLTGRADEADPALRRLLRSVGVRMRLGPLGSARHEARLGPAPRPAPGPPPYEPSALACAAARSSARMGSTDSAASRKAAAIMANTIPSPVVFPNSSTTTP